MKRCVFALLALLSVPVFGQTAAVNGFCEQGAKTATTSGLNSTNKLQGIIPGCTVSVYLTGNPTLATIYADAINTPLSNPFTANTTTGQYLFYAATGTGLDVARSSGTTQTDVIPGGGSGSGGVSSINTLTGPAVFSGTGVSCSLVSGTIQCVFTGGFTAGNDLSGSSTAQNVIGIQNHPIPSPTGAGYIYWNGSAWVYQNPAGAGTVTTVGWTGGIVSIANPTSTPAFTIAGTSGGHPYFSSASTWASTAAGTAHGLWLAEGAGNADTTTGAGIAGQPLCSGGTASDPSYCLLGIGAGGTGSTTAAGTWANITGGTQTGSGTGQINTFPGGLGLSAPFTIGTVTTGASSANPVLAQWNFNAITGIVLQNTNTGNHSVAEYTAAGSDSTTTANFGSFYRIAPTATGYGFRVGSGGDTGLQATNYNVQLSAIGGGGIFMNTGSTVASAITSLSIGSTGTLSFPQIAASSGNNCLQISSAGVVTNTGSACGGGGSMTWPGAAGYALYTGSSSWGTSHLTDSGSAITTSEPLSWSTQAVAASTHNNEGLTAGIPAMINLPTVGTDATSAIQAAVNSTTHTNWMLPDSCAYGIITVSSPITLSVTGTTLSGTGYGLTTQDVCPTIIRQTNASATATFIIAGGYSGGTVSTKNISIENMHIIGPSGSDTTAIAIWFCAENSSLVCNAASGYGGDYGHVRNVLVSGHQQDIVSWGWGNGIIENTTDSAGTTSAGLPLNYIGQSSANSWYVRDLKGTCYKNGVGPAYATAGIQFQFGTGNHISIGDFNGCNTPVIMGDGTSAGSADIEVNDTELGPVSPTGPYVLNNLNSAATIHYQGTETTPTTFTTSPFVNEGGFMDLYTNTPTTGGVALVTPVAGTATTTTGSLTAGTYGYRICATNMTSPALPVQQCTAPSTEETCTLGSTGGCVVNWTPSGATATGYFIYGRTVGGELQEAVVTGQSTSTWTDTGSPTPSGVMDFNNHSAYPLVTDTGAGYSTGIHGRFVQAPSLGNMQQNSYGEQVWASSIPVYPDNGQQTPSEYTRGLFYRVAGRSGAANDDLCNIWRSMSGVFTTTCIDSAIAALQAGTGFTALSISQASTSGNLLSITDSGVVASTTPVSTLRYSATSGNGYPTLIWSANATAGAATLLLQDTGGTYGFYNNQIFLNHNTYFSTFTAATNGTNQSASLIDFRGYAWSTTATSSELIDIQLKSTLTNTAQTPTDTLTLVFSQNANLSGTAGVDFTAATNGFKAAGLTDTALTTQGYVTNTSGGVLGTSTAPAIVNNCGTTTTCANTALANPRTVIGTVALSSGTATVGSMTAWTSTTSFVCTSNDTTATNYSKCVPASTTSITCTGTSTDTIAYACTGN